MSAGIAAFGVHQDGARRAADRQERAELVQIVLALDLTQVDIEANLLRPVEPKDRQQARCWPHTQARGFGVRRTTYRRFYARHGRTTSPSAYSNRHPLEATRSKTAGQSSA